MQDPGTRGYRRWKTADFLARAQRTVRPLKLRTPNGKVVYCGKGAPGPADTSEHRISAIFFRPGKVMPSVMGVTGV